MVVLLKIDRNELESNVHLFTDLDGLLQSQLISFNGLGELGVVLIELSLGQQGISDLGLSEIFLSIFDLEVLLGQELVKCFLDLHNLNYFQICFTLKDK